MFNSTMINTTLDPLSIRFGNTNYFEDSFEDIDRVNMRDQFNDFHHSKMKMKTDQYETLRQRYLRLLGQNKMVWQPTNPDLDKDVEISRIYRRDQEEYLAFMRIRPQGFRAVRTVPAKVEMVFHVLSGRVTFTNKSRQRIMTSGAHITIAAKTTYSIRCGNEDQSAYLIFRLKG